MQKQKYFRTKDSFTKITNGFGFQYESPIILGNAGFICNKRISDLSFLLYSALVCIIVLIWCFNKFSKSVRYNCLTGKK